jgi:DNA repair protein RadC
MSSRELVAIFHQFAEKSHGLAPAAAEILHKFEEILQIFSLSLSLRLSLKEKTIGLAGTGVYHKIKMCVHFFDKIPQLSTFVAVGLI